MVGAYRQAILEARGRNLEYQGADDWAGLQRVGNRDEVSALSEPRQIQQAAIQYTLTEDQSLHGPPRRYVLRTVPAGQSTRTLVAASRVSHPDMLGSNVAGVSVSMVFAPARLPTQ